MNNARHRLQDTLNHRQPQRLCVDFGATAVTGMHVSAVTRLRRAILGDNNWKVKVVEPYQMLGEIDPQLREALGIDIVGVPSRSTMFGTANDGWKPITLFDGTEVLVGHNFNITVAANGDWLIHPQGDMTAAPRGRMPRGGYFFDTIIHQQPIEDEHLKLEDNTEEFALLTDGDVQYWRQSAQSRADLDAAVVFAVPMAGFGDIALVPAPWAKNPRGIRDVEEWYVSTVARRDFVYRIFQKQCEVVLANLDKLVPALNDLVDVAFVSGTDFGTQRGLFISRQAYRDLYKPFHIAVNQAIHRKTKWKTMIHSCGSVCDLLPDLIEAGFDILNPVQTSAEGMEPRRLKQEFGKSLVFWGGGVDTQKTLAFGKPEEVYRQVRERIEIFNDGGGFVFNAIHNVQALTPTENILAMFRAISDSR